MERVSKSNHRRQLGRNRCLPGLLILIITVVLALILHQFFVFDSISMMSTMRTRTLPAEQAQQQQELYKHHLLEQPEASPLLLPSSSSIQKQTKYYDTILPSCEELMQHPNSPYADGAFLTRRSTHVQWRLRSDHSRELVLPNTCILKRYTSIEAKTCLRDKHIMFVGDSLSRYQYLSLAYFLEYDQWSKRFIAGFPSSFCNNTRSSSAIGGTTLEKDAAETETSCSTRSEPNVCSEIEWGAWPPFQQNLGGGDDGGVFHGRMEAWSTRGCKLEGENMQYVTAGDPILITNSGGSISEVNHTDNSNNNNHHNWKGRTKVSFTFEAGWDEVGMFSSGWNYTGCALNGTCRYTQQQYENNMKRCDEENDWENNMDWHYPSIIEAFGGNSSNSEETSTTTVFREQYAGVNYVFYNRGLWGHIPEQKANKMMSLLHDFVTPRDHIDSINNNPKNRCFFKSTTACGRTHDGGHNDHEFGKVRKAAILAGCEYMDVAHLTLEFAPLIHSGDVTSEYMTIFTDTVHYQPWVYEELNNVMLNVLCNAG